MLLRVCNDFLFVLLVFGFLFVCCLLMKGRTFCIAQTKQVSGTGFKDLQAWQLARMALHGLAERNPLLDLASVDRVIYGTVIQEVCVVSFAVCIVRAFALFCFVLLFCFYLSCVSAIQWKKV